MSLGRRFVSTGAGDAVCLTESVQPFGADSTYSSNIALYQLDSDGGTTNNVPDTTTNNNGIASNVTYTTGKYGNAAVFNGSNSKIDTGISSLSSPFSVSMWINEDSLDSGMFFANWNSTSADMYWQTTSDGRLRISIDGFSEQFFGTAGDVTINTWHHIAVTLGSGVYEVYLDGVSLGTSTTSVTTFSSGQNFMIGNSAKSSSPYPFDGLIDQVRIFNKAISAQDVGTLYNETSSTASNTNPLSEGAGVALYSFDYDASDAGGYYDGAPSNVDFGVGGYIKTGAGFNGSNSGIFISSTGTSVTNYDQDFSISCWFKFDDGSTSGNNNFLFMGGGTENVQMWVTLSNGVRFQLYNSGTTYKVDTGAITAGVFYNVVATRSKTDGLKIYLNGVEKDTDSYTGNASPGLSGRDSIGQYFDGTRNNFEGVIDQFRIFSKALNQTEIDSLFAETACVHTATANTADFPSGATAVAHYPLDNSSEDNKGTNDGTDTNIEYRFGKYGQAAVFNGSSSEIDLPNVLTGFTNTYSFSIWVKIDNVNNFPFFASDPSSLAATNNMRFALHQNGNYYFDFGSNSAGRMTGTTPSVWRDGNWHHFVFVSTSTQKLAYVDGSLFNTLSSTTGISGKSTLTVGHYLTNYGGGLYDQIRIFSTALSSSQVTELYNEKPETDTSNFKTVLYEGTGSEQYISNVGMDLETSGGLVWIKKRSGGSTRDHMLYDSVRGAGNRIRANQTTAASNATDELTSFDANGFFLGSSDAVNGSSSSPKYVAWCWKGGGDAVNIGVNSITGSTPSIASDVSANTAAGFSIVKATFNTSSPHTVAHGLSSAPEIIFSKRTSTTGDWFTYSKFLDSTEGEDYFIKLNETDARSDSAHYWNDTAPTNDVFTTGAIYDQSETVIFYCWHSVAGYSKIGSYEGTNSTVTVSDVGFKPSFVMIKNIDDSADWVMLDNRRNTIDDRLNNWLRANSSAQETGAVSTAYITVNDNGFIVANTTSLGTNSNGDTYIYMAFK